MATNLSTSIGGFPVYDSNRPGQIIPSNIINTYSALQIPAYWRAISFLASNLASFPRSVYQNGTPSKTAHPLDKILQRRPNAYQNCTQLFTTWFAHASNYGGGFLRIKRKGMFGVDSLHNLFPENVLPFRYKDEQGNIGQFYYLRQEQEIVSGADIAHIQFSLSYDGQIGMNHVWLHREAMQRGLALDQYMTRYLQQGTHIIGTIEIPQGVGEEQVESLVSQIRTFFRGPEASRDVMVLSDGAKLNNSTLSPEESQLIQQGQYTTKQIAQITNVNPIHLFEYGEMKYNQAATEMIGADTIKYTFRPLIEEIEDELNIKLFGEAELDAGFTIHIDPDALLRGSTELLAASVIAQVNGGLRTRNEGREILDLPEDPDPDSNKLKTLGDTAPPPPQVPQPKLTASAEKPADTFAVKAHITLAHFADMIADVSDRVHSKTEKAKANAQKKFCGDMPDPKAYTAWANVFSQEQCHFAAVAVKPVLQTYANLSGKPVEGMADRIGQKYGQDLATHLYAVGKAMDTIPPDLAQIILSIGGGSNGTQPDLDPQEDR